jgi:hypothetical protein
VVCGDDADGQSFGEIADAGHRRPASERTIVDETGDRFGHAQI